MAEQQWWCARLNVKEDEDEEEVTISIVFDVGEKGLLFSPSLSNYDENVDDGTHMKLCAMTDRKVCSLPLSLSLSQYSFYALLHKLTHSLSLSPFNQTHVLVSLCLLLSEKKVFQTRF